MSGATEVMLMDPSLLKRPEPKFALKPIEMFRNYTVTPGDELRERVRRTYYDMHTNQCYRFVKEKIDHWTRFDKFQSTIMDALERLNHLVDESDPDANIPNIVHAFQTAERIRAEHPTLEWFHLTGLIHDLGKVMAFYDEPQWAVVGDTFPVGCAFSDSIVYGRESFAKNEDVNDSRYSSKYGIYSPNCGLDNVTMSWGHDEYLYRFLKHNKAKLPQTGMNMIRYHSFYPWHASGEYKHLCNEKDDDTLQWVLLFNKYDLYTKSEEVPDIEELKPYYQSLIDKYIPGVLSW